MKLSFSSKVVVRPHRHTHSADRLLYTTTKVFGKSRKLTKNPQNEKRAAVALHGETVRVMRCLSPQWLSASSEPHHYGRQTQSPSACVSGFCPVSPSLHLPVTPSARRSPPLYPVVPFGAAAAMQILGMRAFKRLNG